jgi:hypothetical protein
LSFNYCANVPLEASPGRRPHHAVLPLWLPRKISYADVKE